MKRVVITGLGIISSIGNNQNAVLSSLRKLQSGVVFSQEMKNFGLKSQICGAITVHKKKINRCVSKFMNYATLYAYLAMVEAIQDAGLKNHIYQKNYRVGLIVGAGCNFSVNYHECNNFFKKNPYSIIQSMFSNISACLATFYKIQGITYSMSTACATSASCIHSACELIRSGKQDIIFSGGSEELNCTLSHKFDTIKLLSTKNNSNPQKASRPYDIHRDGFVISGGSGILVLEELHHALSRKAKIYAEIIGSGIATDGFHMTQPSGTGLVQSMKHALMQSGNVIIDYINTHGTSTKIGDIVELQSISTVFNTYLPYISSTKSITGHSLGASGVQEIIYVILMMINNFIVPSINIDTLDSQAKNMNIVLNMQSCNLKTALSNSCGFGGVNVSTILKKNY